MTLTTLQKLSIVAVIIIQTELAHNELLTYMKAATRRLRYCASTNIALDKTEYIWCCYIEMQPLNTVVAMAV